MMVMSLRTVRLLALQNGELYQRQIMMKLVLIALFLAVIQKVTEFLKKYLKKNTNCLMI